MWEDFSDRVHYSLFPTLSITLLWSYEGGANHKESKKQGLLIPINFAGLPVCRSAGLPVCRSAGLPVCRSAGLPVTLNKEKELPIFLVGVEGLIKPFIRVPLNKRLKKIYDTICILILCEESKNMYPFFLLTLAFSSTLLIHY